MEDRPKTLSQQLGDLQLKVGTMEEDLKARDEHIKGLRYQCKVQEDVLEATRKALGLTHGDSLTEAAAQLKKEWSASVRKIEAMGHIRPDAHRHLTVSQSYELLCQLFSDIQLCHTIISVAMGQFGISSRTVGGKNLSDRVRAIINHFSNTPVGQNIPPGVREHLRVELEGIEQKVDELQTLLARIK